MGNLLQRWMLYLWSSVLNRMLKLSTVISFWGIFVLASCWVNIFAELRLVMNLPIRRLAGMPGIGDGAVVVGGAARILAT